MARGERSLERRRAGFAYRKVEGWSKGWAADAVTRAQGLPIQMRQQGLTTALAVLLREGRSESLALVSLLAEWLLAESPQRTLAPPAGRRGAPALLEAAVEADRSSYRAAQADALALLDHVKLLARAVHGKGADRVR